MLDQMNKKHLKNISSDKDNFEEIKSHLNGSN